MTPKQALEQAIAIAEGQAALARLVGKKQGHVSYWLENAVSPEMVIPIESATGVHRHWLRPDIYPDPPEAEPVEAAE